MLFNDKERIVFAGDSVTDMNKTHPFGEGDGLGANLGNGYVHIIYNLLSATYPELNVRITNSGVGGNSSKQLLERWDKDVLELNPDWVSIFIGINDCLNNFLYPERSEILVSPDEYQTNLEKMIESVKYKVKGVFLISPYIAEACKSDKMRIDMDKYRQKAFEVSEKYNCIYVDIQNMFDNYFEKRHQATIAWDRIHPNMTGSYMIAKEFLMHCEFDFYHK